MNYTIINRKVKFRPNSVQKINEENTNIASISKNVHQELLDMSPLLYERLKTYSDRLDFSRVVINCRNIINEKNIELARIKRLETAKANAGFTLITIIIVLGIIGFAFITFFFIKGMLY